MESTCDPSKSWQVASVDIMYLHAPDHKTPLTETLAAMDELHKEGKFAKLGLSNYSAWLVNEVVVFDAFDLMILVELLIIAMIRW